MPVVGFMPGSWSGATGRTAKIFVAVGFVLAILLLRWPEGGAEETTAASPNKSLAGYLQRVLEHGDHEFFPAGLGGEGEDSGLPLGLVDVELLAGHGGEEEFCGFDTSSVTAWRSSFHLHQGGSVLLPSFLAGRGGEGEGGGGRAAAACGCPGWFEAASLAIPLLHQSRAHHMADMDVAMILGQGGRRSRRIDGASTTSKMEASDGDLGRRCTPPTLQVVRPRSLVAGGRKRDPDDDVADGGEDPGLDCFFVFSAGFFLLDARTAFISFLSRGPLCKMYPPFPG